VGEGKAKALPLDRVPELQGKTIDVLKVDVDGYDGEVLAGAKETLCRDKPVVIFEWHPVLWHRAEKDLFEVFEVLRTAGYDRLVWYINTGEFSHFTANTAEDGKLFRTTAAYLERENKPGDPHYDIVALHAQSTIDEVELARMPETRKWSGR
jgi:hypothetical protein